jgi:hypothetical protein
MNKQLVKGAAIANASEGFVNYGSAIGQSIGSSSEGIIKAMQAKKAQKRAANARTASYIDQLNSDVDLTNLTESQQQNINSFLVEGRNEYAQVAAQLAKMDDPSGTQYMEYKNKLNSISRSFQNLSSQVKNYKEDKISYLKDFDQSLVSEGNTPSSVENASLVYTDGADFSVGSGGNLTIWDNQNNVYSNYSELEKPFLKDFKSADTILAMNEKAYNRGASLTGARETMTRQKIQNLISKGGRDTLLSLASDDFVMEGGLGLQDPSLFEPGNEDALKKAVVDGYMNVLKDTAKQGANDKRPASNGRTTGFSGSLKDEVAVSGHVQQNAANFAQLGVKVPDNQRQAKSAKIVSVLNNIDASQVGNYVSRGEAYNMFLDAEGEGDSPENRDNFISEYGDNQIYLYDKKDLVGIDIDTDNPRDLNKLYLQSAGLSNKATNYYIGEYGRATKDKKNKPANTAQELINKYRQ